MHNTGNPLGSKDILDLYDNSEVVDNFVNSQQDEVPDRFGTKRLTLSGLIKRSMALRNEINDFSGALTFKPEWSDVPMNVSEGVGGEGGALNLQAEALGNRSEINKITSREALRRTYQEVGLNLVDGSFEQGAVITSTTDVVLHEKTGKCYSGPVGNVPKGTDPLSGSFVEITNALLNIRLLEGPLKLRDSRFALRDIVSVDDFIFDNDTDKFLAAFSYLINNFGGGSVLVPPKVYLATIDIPSNISLIGFGEKSIIRSAGTGANSYTVKISSSNVGAYPYGGNKTPIKNVRLRDITIDAAGADFGIYAAYCLFTDFVGVNISNAKVRNIFMTAVFSYSIDKMLLSQCSDVGGSIGENLFSWGGGEEGIICNAGNIRRLMTFGNGKDIVYDKINRPEGGAGLIIRGGSGNNFNSYHAEGNRGTGLYVMPMTQCSFYGIYLEDNANDGGSEFRQVINNSSVAVFYDVEPRFKNTDTFHANSLTYIFNYLGTKITGPGFVSLQGKYSNVSVENPLVHTIKLSEQSNVDSSGASTRHNILKPSKYSSVSSFKTSVWQMGVFITLRSQQTIPAGRTILVRNISGGVLMTLNLPSGNYVDGDVIYLPMLYESTALEALSVVNIGYGAGWVGIGQIDIGMYIQLMV